MNCLYLYMIATAIAQIPTSAVEEEEMVATVEGFPADPADGTATTAAVGETEALVSTESDPTLPQGQQATPVPADGSGK